jgi:hypothetical protein
VECELIRSTFITLSACVALLAGPGVLAAAAAPSQLQSATQAFEMQDYDRAITILRPLIAEEAISDPSDLRLSLERLAASYWFTGAIDAARLTFGSLLKAAPNHPLDPLYYPQELISFFEAEKQRLKKLGFIGGAQQPTGRDPKARMTLVKTVIERPMPTIGYLMPFGVGQFANNESGKGAILAVLQGIGIATNIAAWITVEAMKQQGTNQIATGDAGRAEVMDILWIIGTSLFAGAYTYGVVDGFVYRPPALEERRRFELVNPDEARAPSHTLRLGPGPGLGLGVSGSF